MTRLYNAPAGLTDIKSWLFFAIGLIWSAIALIEGVLYTDPFFGYAALQKRVNAAHGDYIDRKNALIANLSDIKDDAVQAMETAQRDLGKRRAEHAAILEGRSRVMQLFREQQDQLERAGNTLLAQYHTANRQARPKETVPSRFDRPWQMERLLVEAHLPEIMLRKSLDEEIRDAEELLTREIHAIHQAYSAAVETYHQIDDIIPGDQHGSAVKKQA